MIESLEGYVGAWLAETHGTKKSLAQSLGYTTTTLNKKLSGKSKLTVIDARKLANKMGDSDGKLFCEICRIAPD